MVPGASVMKPQRLVTGIVWGHHCLQIYISYWPSAGTSAGLSPGTRTCDLFMWLLGFLTAYDWTPRINV